MLLEILKVLGFISEKHYILPLYIRRTAFDGMLVLNKMYKIALFWDSLHTVVSLEYGPFYVNIA